MHVKLYTTFHKDHAKTKADARRYVYKTLNDDPTFVGDSKGGRFLGVICDFFEVNDDAKIIDRDLYEKQLKYYQGRSDNEGEDLITFADLDGNTVDPSFVGQKWLISLWYHM